MLENVVKFIKVFDRMDDEDEDYKSYFREKVKISSCSAEPHSAPPSSYDWRIAKDFVTFLRLFYTMTLKFSGSLYVTSNSCFQQIVAIQTMLNSSATSDNFLLSDMASRMQIKYDKYWGRLENMNPLLVIAVILDPRYKLKYVKFAFEDIFSDCSKRDLMTKKIVDVLYCLYDQYSSVGLESGKCQTQMEPGESSVGNQATGLNDEALSVLDATMQRFLASAETEHQAEKNAEVEIYLQAELADARDPKFDILAWWKVNATKYNVLSLIAHDLLAVPVSTVSSESAFSTGGRVLDAFRSSLSSKMAEALICGQNWISPHTSKLKDLDVDNFDETERAADEESLAPPTISSEDEDDPLDKY